MKSKYIVILLFIFLLWIVGFSTFYKKQINEINRVVQKELDISKEVDLSVSDIWDYSDVLNKENYEKIGINPEKYNSFNDFLLDFKTFTWVLIDPMSEDFVIAKSSGEYISYIPFDLNTRYVFDTTTYKNLAILDIYQSYKDGGVFWWADAKTWGKIIFQKDIVHKETSTLKQIFWRNLEVYKLIDSMEKIKNLNPSKQELLSYLYDFTWNYWSGNILRKTTCVENKMYCNKNTEVSFSWVILDGTGTPIVGATIMLLNNPTIKITSNSSWMYELKFKWSSFSHVRIKASKKWYSDAFSTISVNSYEDSDWNNNYVLNLTLNAAQENISLNKTNIDTYSKGGYYIFESTQSKYFIPKDGLTYINGEKFVWNSFSVYMYELNKWSKAENLLWNDTFEPVYGYVWNLMKTFWMPYIQFFDGSWKELFVRSSNPWILQNKVYHMKELYENYDKIYEALTSEDMQFLLQTSLEKGGYPIDFNFQIQHSLLRWPARWTLDRITWVWSNIGHRVLSLDWEVEMPFYSIKDTEK